MYVHENIPPSTIGDYGNIRCYYSYLCHVMAVEARHDEGIATESRQHQRFDARKSRLHLGTNTGNYFARREGIGDLVILELHTIEELVHIASRIDGGGIRGITVGDLLREGYGLILGIGGDLVVVQQRVVHVL